MNKDVYFVQSYLMLVRKNENNDQNKLNVHSILSD